MANFFKRGKRIIISVEKDELRESAEGLRAVLNDALPLDSGVEILLNLAACEELCMESVAVLASFARESRKSGSTLKVKTSADIRNQLGLIGMDRHFVLLDAAS